MTDRRLQKSYCVTGVQRRLPYNDTMSHLANTQRDVPLESTGYAAGPRPARARVCRVGIAVVAILSTGALAAACGGASSTTGHSAAPSGITASLANRALAYSDCMRTHGEPNMPDPTFAGRHATLEITASSGIDPSSPQFIAATNACRHLVSKGGASPQPTITPADQADYLKGVACMRSHGVPRFPEPVFQNHTVTFNAAGLRIDTHSSQYTRAVRICEKLIPAGLPYSSHGGA